MQRWWLTAESTMLNLYGIRPTIKHYGCMIDVLSRAGHLGVVEGMMQLMPVQHSVTMCGSMMNGFKMHGKADVLERIGSELAELSPQLSAAYVVMSNIYAEVGRWHAGRD
jgi:hypothetical protein